MALHHRLIVALDYANEVDAKAFVARLHPDWCRLKVGKELFTAAGPRLVAEWVDEGYEVFLDLKYHDIPHTVAAAVRAAAKLGVWMVNVHVSGGRSMLLAARDAVGAMASRPLLVGVTVLTSLDAHETAEIGMAEPAIQVPLLASLAKDCGLDGVVCSAHEAAVLRRLCGPAFCLVTPGIRPDGALADDQRRVMTPAAALLAGADYLVMGRPITQAADPVGLLRRLHDEISSAVLPIHSPELRGASA